MRLLYRLQDGGFSLTRDFAKPGDLPRYAALSHTWFTDGEDVNYNDIASGTNFYKQKPGYYKLAFCAAQATRDGLRYFWIDSCCIDRSNSVELSEAINSMYRWYWRSDKCYALLSDVHFTGRPGLASSQDPLWEDEFVASKWHTRGWCLQELLAPRDVKFYSKEGMYLGSKITLQHLITKVTGIPSKALRTRSLSSFSIQERMLWAKGRQTTRPEDKAYCLLGILEVFMAPLYGEGDYAFERLREEISKRVKKQRDTLEVLSLPEPSLPKNWTDFISKEQRSSTLCLPDTRVELLEEIDDWVERDGGSLIFWLSDSAGTGKSTVARTVARKYYDRGHLGGCFFFTRGGGDASRADALFTTLAGQLAIWVPGMHRHIQEAISADPNIVRKSLRDQWTHLILEPLSKIGEGYAPPAVIIVIDALDECDNEKDARTILKLLSMVKVLDSIRLRIFLTSRPESHIRLGFHQIPTSGRGVFVQHDKVPSLIDRDLATFFKSNFDILRKEWGWEDSFPSNDTVARLVRFSGGLFVWASTACRYIRDGNQESRLRLTALAHQHSLEFGHPEGRLDALYANVLGSCVALQHHEDQRETLRTLLGHVVLLFAPLSAKALESLLVVPKGHVHQTLAHLHTIFSISDRDDKPITLHHPAFCDFILDPRRCIDNTFQVDRQTAHRQLAKGCIRLMARTLKQNICGLDSPGTRATDVTAARVQQCISPELQYACLYWVKHLKQSQMRLRDNDEADCFVQEHLFHWIEVLALIRKGPEMATSIRMYHALLDPGCNVVQLPFVKDARRFIIAYQAIAEQAPLQIYCSGLAFMQPSNLVRTHYRMEMQPWIRTVNIAEAEASATKVEYNYVNDLAFTPDSLKLVSGSVDEFVRVWDLPSASPLATFSGQEDKISSVAISSDGVTVASGSDDSTVMVKTLNSDEKLFKLTGHTKWVNAVVFSPDDKLLATGSMDETIKIWDLETRSAIRTIQAGGGCVNSIAVSPDGVLLASGTNDDSVRLWDVTNGKIRLILDGHSGPVNSVRFSRHGQHLASGSDDMTVRVWDVRDGDGVLELTGHQKSVRAVDFSRDGCRIVSGSEDGTLKLWDVSTGADVATLTGHTSGINAVAYSPDGKLLVSCAFNDEVLLWDAETFEALGRLPDFGQPSPTDILPYLTNSQKRSGIQSLHATGDGNTIVRQHAQAHAGRITSVVSGPTSDTIASGSNDNSIKLWERGKWKSHLRGHSASVTRLSFSPDGSLLASASDDTTAKLWSINNGLLLHDLTGHSGPVRLVVFSRHGHNLATASTAGQIMLWSVATGKQVFQFQGHPDMVTDLAFSPNDQLLASSSTDCTVRIWDLESGLEACEPLEGHADAVNSVAFSYDGTLLVTSSADATVKIWDKRKPGHGTLYGHAGAVRSAAFSSDMRMVVSCSDDESIIIWDLMSRTMQHKLEVGISLSMISFGQADRELATDRGTLRLSYPMVQRQLSSRPDMFVTKNWLQQDRKDTLWLDKSHQATCVGTTDDSIVLGHANGAISFVTLQSDACITPRQSSQSRQTPTNMFAYWRKLFSINRSPMA